MKGLDAFAEIVGAAQPAVALAFELDCERQAGILDIVYQLLRAALRQCWKSAQLFGQPIARRFKFVIGDAVGRTPPLIGLPTWNAPRAHHNVLGPRDADHLLQARGAARTRDLPETLLGKGIKAGFRDQTKIGVKGAPGMRKSLAELVDANDRRSGASRWRVVASRAGRVHRTHRRQGTEDSNPSPTGAEFGANRTSLIMVGCRRAERCGRENAMR